MRKQELVHLHALCALVRAHVESREDVTPNAFARYDGFDVAPAAIYRGKAAHRRAVLQLAADVTAAIDDDRTHVADGTADGGAASDVDGRR